MPHVEEAAPLETWDDAVAQWTKAPLLPMAPPPPAGRGLRRGRIPGGHPAGGGHHDRGSASSGLALHPELLHGARIGGYIRVVPGAQFLRELGAIPEGAPETCPPGESGSSVDRRTLLCPGGHALRRPAESAGSW